jgi:hypothetical protein
MAMTDLQRLSAISSGLYHQTKSALDELNSAVKRADEYLSDEKINNIAARYQYLMDCWELHKLADEDRKRSGDAK